MNSLSEIEEHLMRQGFLIATLHADGEISIHGAPERDSQNRLWMWYSHIGVADLEVGIHDNPVGAPSLKIKDCGVTRTSASEFSCKDFDFFALMLADIIQRNAKSR